MSVLHTWERAWAVSPLFVVGERKTVISLDMGLYLPAKKLLKCVKAWLFIIRRPPQRIEFCLIFFVINDLSFSLFGD